MPIQSMHSNIFHSQMLLVFNPSDILTVAKSVLTIKYNQFTVD